jgi:hypothetical protein
MLNQMELITGKKFEALAGDNIIYSKIDDVRSVKLPDFPFKLITHNGDEPIDGRHMTILNHPLLIKWYGTNVCIEHPKLQSIPIGIPNPQWIREEIYFNEVPEVERTKLFYFGAWSRDNNRDGRAEAEKRLGELGYKMDERKGIVEYLTELKRALFVPAPNGNGIDTHRLWECMYMGAIPIVTESINSMYFKDMPVLITGHKWGEFPAEHLSEGLYDHLIKNASREKLDFNYWKKLIQEA